MIFSHHHRQELVAPRRVPAWVLSSLAFVVLFVSLTAIHFLSLWELWDTETDGAALSIAFLYETGPFTTRQVAENRLVHIRAAYPANTVVVLDALVRPEIRRLAQAHRAVIQHRGGSGEYLNSTFACHEYVAALREAAESHAGTRWLMLLQDTTLLQGRVSTRELANADILAGRCERKMLYEFDSVIGSTAYGRHCSVTDLGGVILRTETLLKATAPPVLWERIARVWQRVAVQRITPGLWREELLFTLMYMEHGAFGTYSGYSDTGWHFSALLRPIRIRQVPRDYLDNIDSRTYSATDW